MPSDEDGCTALMLAEEKDHTNIVRLLESAHAAWRLRTRPRTRVGV